MHEIHDTNIAYPNGSFENPRTVHTPTWLESNSMANHQLPSLNNQIPRHSNPHYNFEYANFRNRHAITSHELPIQYHQMQSSTNSQCSSGLLNAPAWPESHKVVNNQLPVQNYEMTLYPKSTLEEVRTLPFILTFGICFWRGALST